MCLVKKVHVVNRSEETVTETNLDVLCIISRIAQLSMNNL